MKTFLLQSLFILFFSTGMFFSATNMVVAQEPTPGRATADLRAEQLRVEAAAAAATPAASPGRSLGEWVAYPFLAALAWVVKWIALAVLGIFAWILGMAGILLNLSVSYLVIGMGDLIKTGGFGVPIDTMWKIFRDLVNISFVFALIYIGITTIINSGASGAKKLLGAVIISALLVNFSLFFAKATIDVSNIIADNIYRKMLPTPQMASFETGISGAFANKIGILQLMANQESRQVQARLQEAMSYGNGGISFTILYSIGAGILMFVLAYAFALGAFLLIIRFVMLILLMIFSPIAFLPDVLPGFGEYRKKWWSTLISQAFFAPVYLFGLYLSLYILSSSPINLGTDGLAALFTPGGGFASGSVHVLLYYVIAIILIIGTTSLAKSMSASGASSFGKLTDWTEKKIKGGLKSTFMLPTKAITKPAAYLAREGIKIGGRRILPGVGTAASWAGKWNDRLQGTKGGRAFKMGVSIASLGALNERGRRDLIKKGKTAKIGSSSYQDERDFEKELARTESGEKRKRERNAAIKLSKDTPGDIDLRNKAQKLIQDMTLVELEEEELTALKEIAGLLSNKQADQIKDHKDKWNDGEKAQIKDKRTSQRKDMFRRNPVQFMNNLKPADIAKLPIEILRATEALTYITSDVLRKIQDDAELGRAQNKDVTDLRNLILANGDASAKEYLTRTPRAWGYYGKPPETPPVRPRGFTPEPTDEINRGAMPF